ncbi:myb/SANT-like DNA-binding domain-containing protein 4 [Haliotis cracherodii]|uniref:myb/SANT-like DNA-binding domain-containing protein 4 n=1 Tax=Haliotis cracherodii TaxID=6455 RepID=UPI0039E81D34
MAEHIPKTRKPNFTESETLMIVEQVKKHKDILTSKLSDAVTNERKKDIWSRISEYINNRTRNVQRTSGDIRRRWKNMVGAARKEVARIKSMPSGSASIPEPSDLSLQILDINPEWQDVSTYNINGPDPCLSSFMKVEACNDDDEEDDMSYISSSPGTQSDPSRALGVRTGDNVISPRHTNFSSSSQGMTSYTMDCNQSNPKKRRLEEASHLHQEIMHLDRENLTLEKEKMKIEKEKLSMEKEQLAIERQKLGMEREKLAMEKEKMNMEKEKLALEISYWKRKLLQVSRNPFDSNERSENGVD